MLTLLELVHSGRNRFVLFWLSDIHRDEVTSPDNVIERRAASDRRMRSRRLASA